MSSFFSLSRLRLHTHTHTRSVGDSGWVDSYKKLGCSVDIMVPSTPPTPPSKPWLVCLAVLVEDGISLPTCGVVLFLWNFHGTPAATEAVVPSQDQ